MATSILASSQYHLPESDRQKILSSIPQEIQYPNGIVPDLVLRQNSEYFPSLQGLTHISQSEMGQIMSAEVTRQRTIFVRMHGNDGVFMTT